MIKTKNANNANKLQSELEKLNEIQVFDENIHEIKKDILEDYFGEFENVGKSTVGDEIRETHIRLRNITDYESYINAVDERHEAEESIFTGYIYKLKTPQFNLVERSQYGNGCNFKQQFFEYRGKNCYVPSNGYCFIKCINHLTKSDYKEQYLEFN